MLNKTPQSTLFKSRDDEADEQNDEMTPLDMVRARVFLVEHIGDIFVRSLIAALSTLAPQMNQSESCRARKTRHLRLYRLRIAAPR